MSLKILPLPIYIIICSLLGGIMIYFSITRREKDRKGLIVVYATLTLMTPFMILGRIVQTYFSDYIKYYDFASIVVYAILFIIFIEFTVMGVKDFFKGKLNKQVFYGLLLGWPCVLFIIFIILKVLINF